MNYNTKIALDKIPGYREEYLQDAAGNAAAYACIPLNDSLGILTNQYVVRLEPEAIYGTRLFKAGNYRNQGTQIRNAYNFTGSKQRGPTKDG